MICDYLQFHGFFNTLAVFSSEAGLKVDTTNTSAKILPDLYSMISLNEERMQERGPKGRSSEQHPGTKAENGTSEEIFGQGIATYLQSPERNALSEC